MIYGYIQPVSVRFSLDVLPLHSISRVFRVMMMNTVLFSCHVEMNTYSSAPCLSLQYYVWISPEP